MDIISLPLMTPALNAAPPALKAALNAAPPDAESGNESSRNEDAWNPDGMMELYAKGRTV